MRDFLADEPHQLRSGCGVVLNLTVCGTVGYCMGRRLALGNDATGVRRGTKYLDGLGFRLLPYLSVPTVAYRT